MWKVLQILFLVSLPINISFLLEKKPTKAKAQKSVSAPPAHQSSVWSQDGISAVAPPDRLANFYRKYNKIMLDNVAIAKERERLALENAQLQDLINQYISGTRITEDTLAEDNPLFVVNGRYFIP